VDSTLVGAENTRPNPTEQTKRQAHLDQALATLKKARAAGFVDLAHMQQDTVLDQLRDRADLQELMKDLALVEPVEVESSALRRSRARWFSSTHQHSVPPRQSCPQSDHAKPADRRQKAAIAPPEGRASRAPPSWPQFCALRAAPLEGLGRQPRC
jgi:hypothetical protein